MPTKIKNIPGTILILKSGFTLIELLVVIAIIGILSAVILTNLSSARYKGQYANIKANLDSLRTQTTNYALLTGYYANGSTTAANGVSVSGCQGLGGMFSDPTIQNMISSIGNNGATAISCVAGTNMYAVAAQDSQGTWCVDYLGSSTSTTEAIGVTTAGSVIANAHC